ncbi:MAG: 50S ribosomal protein L23 [Vicingaceae bacterium]|jgi:large subunit ribosomal protein L23|nr:MAG: 50S ribosomal protein L23 [Flavobacteriales bacterium BRH_c54]MBL1231680.1 50S ribosomal protein L23 [Flavobacteriales bacterium]MBQ21296.1 50S ribosomal protein L23 [Flavobacteriales bacterium]MDF1676072.1 50S ribosomal protein L23 [Vicingaceae bacterium]|tara:strand:+ start:367 stop:657 length:291 start_codon:yes stop_codon:yes gene_type:complete
MEIIIKPVITEKMTSQTEKFNRYAFVVNKKANKIQIKDAIKDMYNVTVESINTMNYAGKSKSRYTKAGLVSGRTNNYKKAVVTLSEGEAIDFFSNI